MLRVLLTVVDTVTGGGDHRVTAHLDPLLDLVGPDRDELGRTMHGVADDFATRTMSYLAENPRGRDQSVASPGMIVIDAAGHAVAELHRFGYPAIEHQSEHAVWAASRAAMAVLVWAQVVLGHVEWDRRVRKARKRVDLMRGG